MKKILRFLLLFILSLCCFSTSSKNDIITTSKEIEKIDDVILGGDTIGLHIKTNVQIVGKYEVLTNDGNVKPWEYSNIQDGDIIYSIDNNIINSNDDLNSVVKNSKMNSLTIILIRNEEMINTNIKVVKNEKEMKSIVHDRKEKERDKRLDAMLPAHVRREAVAGEDDIPQLNLIIKANTNGSAEAVSQAIAQLESNEIKTKIIHVGVGDISEADVMLASASNALILGFTVKEDANALAAAEKEGVTIKKYDIIYQILEDIEKTMLSLLEPEVKEVELGKAEVRQVFTIGKTTRIAGCYVTEGKIVRSKDAVLYRDGKEIFRGAIDQLKRFKDDVKEVAQGFECGISFAKWNDIEEGDIIEVSTKEEVERQSL